MRIEPRRGPVEVRWGERTAPLQVGLPGEGVRTGILPGGWIRRVGEVLEEGLLAGGAIAIRWTVPATVNGTTHGPGTFALKVVDDRSDEALRKFLAPLPARALQRVPEPGIRAQWGDLPGLDEAAVVLDIEGPIPDLDPAEHGIALLLLGHHERAWKRLEAMDPTPGFLHLATLWGGWSGAPGRLLALEGPLREAVRSLEPPRGAAWPGPARLVHDLARILEPVAPEEWRKALLVQSALLKGEGAKIPPLTAFAETGDHRKAGRLVRSWIMGQLGADAEMAYGRLTLAPILGQRDTDAPPPPDAPLTVTGLRAGDARIDLHCRREPGRHTFRLVQQAGRVPVNVVFDPWLPVSRIRQVRMGDEPVEVDLREEAGGTRVRLQFPLDPERRLIVDA